MTISKNTRKAKEAINQAKEIRCYSLSNNFSGQPMVEYPTIWGGPVVDGRYTQLLSITQQGFLAEELKLRHAKLSLEDGHYRLHIHSNLWYEFIN